MNQEAGGMRSGNSFSLVGEWVMSIDIEVMMVSGYRPIASQYFLSRRRHSSKVPNLLVRPYEGCLILQAGVLPS